MLKQIDVAGESFRVFVAGAGKPVVLVHGFPLDHSMWSAQLGPLAERYQVIAPDLRGFGGSVVTPGVTTMEQMADDIAGILAALKITEPVAFCGLSMGGYVAWRFWERHRNRLARLILCDTRADADSPTAAANRLTTAEKVLSEGTAFLVEAMAPRLFAVDHQTTPYAAAVRQVMAAAPPEGVAAALRGMAQRPNVTSWLGQIDVPTLVLCGEHDVISPAKEMRAFAEAIPAARFCLIQNAGHMAPGEQPEAVNQVIGEFLG